MSGVRRRSKKGHIMSYGYIYLMKDLNADGSVRAYCFGKTSRDQRRRQEYRKENPFIRNMASYSASDMHAAEEELKAVVRSEGMALVDNSDEWIRPECIQRFKPIWHRVAEKYKAKTPQTKSKVDLEREAFRQREQQLAEKARRAEALRRQERKAERAKKKAENAKKVEEIERVPPILTSIIWGHTVGLSMVNVWKSSLLIRL